MRLTLPSTRFLLVLSLVGASLGAPESQGEESRRPGSMTQRLRELETLIEPEAVGEETVASPSSNTSLQSTARGLTSSDEWRQMFPSKKK